MINMNISTTINYHKDDSNKSFCECFWNLPHGKYQFLFMTVGNTVCEMDVAWNFCPLHISYQNYQLSKSVDSWQDRDLLMHPCLLNKRNLFVNSFVKITFPFGPCFNSKTTMAMKLIKFPDSDPPMDWGIFVLVVGTSITFFGIAFRFLVYPRIRRVCSRCQDFVVSYHFCCCCFQCCFKMSENATNRQQPNYPHSEETLLFMGNGLVQMEPPPYPGRSNVVTEDLPPSYAAVLESLALVER